MLCTPSHFRSNPGKKIVGEGLIEIGHFNSDLVIYGRNGPYDIFEFNGVPVYGVCDSPAQFMEKFGEAAQADSHRLAVFFTHVPKEPANARRGGGWRWRKWGKYVGSGTPTTEYLDDEPEFCDGVYVFHVHDIDWKPERKAAHFA